MLFADRIYNIFHSLTFVSVLTHSLSSPPYHVIYDIPCFVAYIMSFVLLISYRLCLFTIDQIQTARNVLNVPFVDEPFISFSLFFCGTSFLYIRPFVLGGTPWIGTHNKSIFNFHGFFGVQSVMSCIYQLFRPIIVTIHKSQISNESGRNVVVSDGVTQKRHNVVCNLYTQTSTANIDSRSNRYHSSWQRFCCSHPVYSSSAKQHESMWT